MANGAPGIELGGKFGTSHQLREDLPAEHFFAPGGSTLWPDAMEARYSAIRSLARPRQTLQRPNEPDQVARYDLVTKSLAG